jgi:hypothetical protein
MTTIDQFDFAPCRHSIVRLGRSKTISVLYQPSCRFRFIFADVVIMAIINRVRPPDFANCFCASMRLCCTPF